MFAGNLELFERHFDGVAEVPIEWWDVVDDGGLVRYQLWLCFGDAGALVDRG